MARAPRLVDGRRRRETVRRTKRKHRKGALDAKKASDRRELQIKWSMCMGSAMKMALFAAIFAALSQSAPLPNADDDPFMVAEKGVYGNYALITRLLFTAYLHRAGLMEQLDMALYDIPPEEIEEEVYVKPIAYRTIDSLQDDRVARDLTRFTKDELREMYEISGIPDVVRMECAAHYVFGGEELFLFALAKIALGQPNVYLCDHVFGGEPDRWSYGYPWFLRFMNDRFDRVLGMDGIHRFRDHFQEFADPIENAMKVASSYTDPISGLRGIIPGVLFHPGDFKFIGFIDCS
eukprot:CAMPEP_0197715424 /NCGR_PEP_ID=MMETSP1434-20131217/589_1 /TAXON_ID=265543 /ORGANISM="Minutocellus polymorphus, Strain CCMP3303" /LENGTH=291 /DNA_ID=CAMNT_0043299521 /DNA_START=154 /DNA_END=1025 /DNA_ORIENTATION=+